MVRNKLAISLAEARVLPRRVLSEELSFDSHNDALSPGGEGQGRAIVLHIDRRRVRPNPPPGHCARHTNIHVVFRSAARTGVLVTTLRVQVLLSLQRAFWDLVTPNLRGVAVRILNNHVSARLIFENDPTDEDLENMSEAETYAIADFSDDVTVLFDADWMPTSQPRELMTDEEWVYLRKEP